MCVFFNFFCSSLIQLCLSQFGSSSLRTWAFLIIRQPFFLCMFAHFLPLPVNKLGFPKLRVLIKGSPVCVRPGGGGAGGG